MLVSRFRVKAWLLLEGTRSHSEGLDGLDEGNILLSQYKASASDDFRPVTVVN